MYKATGKIDDLASVKSILLNIDDVTIDVRKFSEYALDPINSNGKHTIFESYGYTKKHANELVALYKKQAYEKFNSRKYSYGKLDRFGQRITIDIEIQGIGVSTGKMGKFKTGWIINSDGTIRLITPFAG